MTEFQKFSIDYIVSKDLGEAIRKWNTPHGYDITCPFCGGIRKFNVNTNKDVARCNKCGASFNSLTLHAALTNKSNSEAYQELALKWIFSSKEQKEEMKSRTITPPLKNFAKDFPWIVTDYNDYFINSLTLLPQHKEDLLRRGLSEEQIEAGRYRSYPIDVDRCAEDTMLKPGITRYEVFFQKKDYCIPGFYNLQTPHPKLVKRSSGYLIPVKTLEQYVTCFQIRYDPLSDTATADEKESYHKYAWLSSSEKKTGIGVTGANTINHAGFDTKTDDQLFNFPIYRTVNLTEGILKSDIAAALSGHPFIGLPGVNCTSQLEGCLTQLKNLCGTQTINICIDMDYREKKEVASALENIIGIIKKVGLTCRMIRWDSQYKGIDDFLCAQKKANGTIPPILDK